MGTVTGAVTGMALALAGCDADAETDEDVHPSAPGFVQLAEAFFVPSCSSDTCHGDGGGAAGLSFSNLPDAYAHLLEATPVNPMAASSGLGLIVPNSAQDSLLVHKLEMSSADLAIAGYGSRMPVGGAGAPGPDTLAALHAWIEAGAPYEGQAVDADFTTNDDGNMYVLCDTSDAGEMRDCFEELPSADGFVRYFSEPITVPPNSEILLCTYLDEITNERVSFKSFSAHQMLGGHHAALYVAFQPEAPGLRSCTGAAMTNLRILAGAFAGNDGLVPADVRLELPAARQVVLQSHYINPTDVPIVVMDAVDLELTTEEDSPLLADSFVLNMDGFEIPADGSTYAYGNGDGCRIGRPLDIHSIQLHTHESGVLMELTHHPAGEEPYLLFSETDGIMMREGAAALILDPPLALGPDDKLSVVCEWENEFDEDLRFPDEMCAAFMYYSPGEGFLLCDDDATEPEVLGSGSPGDGCVPLGAPGNEMGVGRACTAEGTECLDAGGEATLCLATFDARANFCSMFGCEEDEDCGAGAGCYEQTIGSACVPDQCND
jgi:hypothetical protein